MMCRIALASRSRRSTFPAAALLAAACLAACGGDTTGLSINYKATYVAPIVNSALPTSLQASGLATSDPLSADRLLATRPLFATTGSGCSVCGNADSAIVHLFKNQYINIINATSVTGMLTGFTSGIDYQLGLIKTQLDGMQSEQNSPACLANAPGQYTIDLSAIDPMMVVTLHRLQCIDSLNGGNGQPTNPSSGLVFGSDGTNSSLWGAFGFPGTGTYAQTGGFLVLADIDNVGSSTPGSSESVDGMWIEWSAGPSHGNRISMARFRAVPLTHTFEFSMASNQADLAAALSASTGSNPQAKIGAGFRMISDGNLIYADGQFYQQSTTPNGWTAFQVCIDATDLTVNSTAGACDALAASFSFAKNGPLTFAEVTGTGLTGTNVPGPTSNTNQTQPVQSVLDKLSAVFPAGNASGVAKAFGGSGKP